MYAMVSLSVIRSVTIANIASSGQDVDDCVVLDAGIEDKYFGTDWYYSFTVYRYRKHAHTA
jgi:hypothetical protein